MPPNFVAPNKRIFLAFLLYASIEDKSERGVSNSCNASKL